MRSEKTTKFIKESKTVHGNRYKYTCTQYNNDRQKVKIVCRTHGIFTETPIKHLLGRQCPECIKARKEANK